MNRDLGVWVLLLLSSLPAHAQVRVVRVPEGAAVPEVVLDTTGTLHVTYGSGGQPGNAFYVQSRDGGKTFSTPVQINQQANLVTNGMERGPKLAIGRDGVLHVIWHGFYKNGGGVWYNRSTDGGKTFEAERNLLDSKYGADNATLAADADGNVIALWTGGFPGVQADPQSPYGAPLICSRSTDNGRSFSKNQLVKYDHPTRICECCRLEAKIQGDKLFIGFRGSWQSLRDPYLMIGDKKANQFRVVPISAENWKNVCPMQGIPFSVDASGRVLASWMVRGKAYWSLSDVGATKFATKVGAPGNGNAAMPMALMNRQGAVFFLWKDGQQIQWAIYDQSGSSKEQGQAGMLPGRNKPTAFVDADDRFCVVF